MSGCPAFEYRVTWRRSRWSERTSTKSRIFGRLDVAETFLAKLQGVDRPDLSEVVSLRFDRRTVVEWTEVVR